MGSAPPARSPRARALARLRHDALGVAGLGIVLALFLAAALAPQLAPYDPIAIDLSEILRPPSRTHWMGTDDSGRDVFSRVLWGARVSMTVAVVIRLVTLVIGIVVGAIAGFYEGWVDTVTMRMVEILLAFPGLLLLIGLASALGPGFLSLSSHSQSRGGPRLPGWSVESSYRSNAMSTWKLPERSAPPCVSRSSDTRSLTPWGR